MDARPKTIFCDVDGTLIHHYGDLMLQISNKAKLLPGVLEKFNEWDKKGYNLILTTGRRESMRELTERQLKECGLFWDQLIMGVGGGHRVIINDLKSGGTEPTAIAVNVERNVGMSHLEI